MEFLPNTICKKPCGNQSQMPMGSNLFNCIFRCWVEDWEKEATKKNDSVQEPKLLQKYKDLIFFDPDRCEFSGFWNLHCDLSSGNSTGSCSCCNLLIASICVAQIFGFPGNGIFFSVFNSQAYIVYFGTGIVVVGSRLNGRGNRNINSSSPFFTG